MCFFMAPVAAATAASAAGTAAAAGTVAATTAAATTAAAAGTAAAGTAAAAGTSWASIATYASLASTALGAVTSFMGAGNSAKAAAGTAAYNAQVAENNRLIALENSRMASASGNQQATIEGMKTRAAVGSMKAQQAASGVNVNTGSAVDVRSSAAELGELNALTVRSNAARQAYGYDVQAANAGGEAELQRASGRNAANAGVTTQISSLLGGAASVGGQFAQGKRLGLI